MFSKASRYGTFYLIISLAALSFFIPIVAGIDEPSASVSISPAAPYETGTPVLRDIWVDPSHGNDANTGSTSSQAVATLTEAWRRVPKGTALTSTGYRIRLQPGDYPGENMPGYWELALGSSSCPVIIQAEGGIGTSRLHGYIDLQNSRYSCEGLHSIRL